MSSEQFIDSSLVLITGSIVAYLCWRGFRQRLFGQRGYLLVSAGIALILMGLILDLSDDFPTLRKYVFNGRAAYADSLRWYGGYMLGGVLMLVGFAQWVPLIVTLRNAERDLKTSNDYLRTEISDRVQAEAELQRIKAIMDATTDFVGLADATDLRFVYLNPAARKAMGLADDEDVVDLVVSDAHPDWTNSLLSEQAFPLAIKSGSWSGEGAWISRDGVETFTSITILSHKGPSGELQSFSTISRDISDRKRSEQLLVERAVETARAKDLLRSKARMLQAVDSIRKEIAQGLHSSVQSKLIVLNHRLDEVTREAAEGSRSELTDTRRILSEVTERDLDSLSQQLYPAILRRGLVPALQSLSDRFESAVTINITFDRELERRERADVRWIRESVRLAAYRITENALTNVLKHSKATAVKIELDQLSAQLLRLRIEDDGVGFVVDTALRGDGLASMKDYAESLGGECVIRSDPSEGTQVTATLPLDPSDT